MSPRTVIMVTTFAVGAAAEPAATPRACSEKAYDGQRLRDDGDLLGARRAFAQCLKVSCPAAIRVDCGIWLDAVERQLPSVVFAAHEANRDLRDVNVTVDGQVAKGALDGIPISLNPGPHTFVFRYRDEERVSTVLLQSGEQARIVSVDFTSAGPSKPVRAQPSSSAASTSTSRRAGWIIGGAGIALLATGAVLGLGALDRRAELARDCGAVRACTQGDVDAVRTRLVVSDVLLGASLIAVGVAAYLLWVAPGRRGVAPAALSAWAF